MDWLTLLSAKLSRWVLHLACLCLAALGIIVIYGVVLRYVFNASQPYVEQVALEGLVAIALAVGHPRVAPYGGRVARLGTNPLAFGFPTSSDPILVDLATSAISGGELRRRARDQVPLPVGIALDSAGRPTLNAAEALDGGLEA